jgi:hypothetical protein
MGEQKTLIFFATPERYGIKQIEKSESGPSFWRVQIWNDRSQKPKTNTAGNYAKSPN